MDKQAMEKEERSSTNYSAVKTFESGMHYITILNAIGSDRLTRMHD